MTVFNSFADLAQARINLADAREGITESYDGAFLEHSDLAKLNIVEAPIAAEMPDPDMARRAVEMAIGTIFDVLKDTRMEEFAQQLAWGMEETSSDRRQRCSSHSASRISRQSSIRYRLRYARKSSPR